MRSLFLFASILFLVLFLALYFQYRGEIAAARQRVLEGSQLLITENGMLEYAVEGEGPAVLVIHGAGGGYDQGMLIGKKALGEGFTYISVSRFGYLRSSFMNDSTVEDQAAIYVELLNHLEVNKAIIVGASAGGPSALQFAYDYPERSSALVLLSAVSMFMGDEIPISTRVINTIQRSDFLFWAVLKMFRTQFSEMVGIPQYLYDELPPEDKKYADDMLDFMNPISTRRPGNIYEAKIRPLSGEAMSRITVPTIILHAKDDFLVTFDHAEFVNQNIQNSELVTFESGGHALVAELETISARINDFLLQNRTND